MSKNEAKTLAASAHANLLDRLANADAREAASEWSHDEAKTKRDLAYEQYMHVLDTLMDEVAA